MISSGTVEAIRKESGNVRYEVFYPVDDAEAVLLIDSWENQEAKDGEFDVVFSNAVFHWIDDHDTLLKNIYRALKPKGMLVCEFGAKGNIAAIELAFSEACADFGYRYKTRFNFPAADDFGLLLKNNGFTIDKICDYDRPTPLKDKEEGLKNWMKQFFASDLSGFSEERMNAILDRTELSVRSSLWNGEEWVADYRRLRVIACKP